jgi:hypothetical protein
MAMSRWGTERGSGGGTGRPGTCDPAGGGRGWGERLVPPDARRARLPVRSTPGEPRGPALRMRHLRPGRSHRGESNLG